MKVREYEQKHGATNSLRKPPGVVPFLYLFKEPLTPDEARERIAEEMAVKGKKFADLAQRSNLLTVQQSSALEGYRKYTQAKRQATGRRTS